jgi:uncharacterized protein (DUF433 family)
MFVTARWNGWRFRVSLDLMETPITQNQTPIVPAEMEGTIPVIREYIGIKPGYCGGKPHILGHRIKVEQIAVMHERMGMSASKIVEDLPTITLAQVYAALAYYHDHRDEIEADIRAGDEFVERLRAGQPSIFEKARQRDAQDDSIPPR